MCGEGVGRENWEEEKGSRIMKSRSILINSRPPPSSLS